MNNNSTSKINHSVMPLYNKARKGDAEAEFNLARCYETGDGIEKNIIEAVRWYLKAADQGKVEAEAILCTRYGYSRNTNAAQAKPTITPAKKVNNSSDWLFFLGIVLVPIAFAWFVLRYFLFPIAEILFHAAFLFCIARH